MTDFVEQGCQCEGQTLLLKLKVGHMSLWARVMKEGILLHLNTPLKIRHVFNWKIIITGQAGDEVFIVYAINACGGSWGLAPYILN